MREVAIDKRLSLTPLAPNDDDDDDDVEKIEDVTELGLTECYDNEVDDTLNLPPTAKKDGGNLASINQHWKEER